MPTQLWSSINYKTPVKYFLNTYIREYDLSKANISALYYTNRISEELYNSFANMEKDQREITIGKMIARDSSIYTDIQTGIKEAKRRLVFANNIEDFEIVSIKNDAVFVLGRPISIVDFPPFLFKMKNEYTMYMQLQDLEVYYSDYVDPLSTDGSVKITCDIKGISDETLILHHGGMFDIVCEACYRLQREDPRLTMEWISPIYDSFINRKLPWNYYRSFDSESKFMLHTFTRATSIDTINDSMVNFIDINRNLSILRDIMGIISSVYQSRILRRG